MTIGEYVERRGLMLRYLSMALIAAAIAAIFVFPEYFGVITRWKGAFCFLPVLLLYGILAMTTKCPRCRAGLGESINAAAIPFSSSVPDACPRCGVSFNEPMEDTKGQG
jgi:hypothetical protein